MPPSPNPAQTRHRRQQQDGLLGVRIEVLMFRHRGNTDQIAPFPIPPFVVVDVIARDPR